MRVNAGTDHQAAVMASTSSNGTGTYAPGNYLAMTGDSAAPGATDTTLASEYAAASGGLNRALATYAHTAGVASYTLTKTYTMNGNDASPAIPAKMAVFNASSTGTMIFESAIPSPPTMLSGDQLTLTETVTI